MLHEMQTALRRSILEDDSAAARALVGGDTAAHRLALYRNNTLGSLAGVLAAGFPVVERLVGPAFFRAAARRFAAANPPRIPQLLAYGGDFPDFLAGFEPARRLPYLADVARLEWARQEAWLAGEARALEPAELAAVDAQHLAALVPTLHPSVRLVASPHPIGRIWQANQPEHETVPRVDLAAGPERLLVHRRAGAVVHRSLSPGGLALVEAVRAGHPLGMAAEAALAAEPALDLQPTLAALLAVGLFARPAD